MSQKTESKNKKVPPCHEACCKCGSTDIHRVFRRAGSRWPEVYTRVSPIVDSVFLEREDAYSFVVKKDCILHHCRTCQFAWGSDTLDSKK